jgi:hypothetical protein
MQQKHEEISRGCAPLNMLSPQSVKYTSAASQRSNAAAKSLAGCSLFNPRVAQTTRTTFAGLQHTENPRVGLLLQELHFIVQKSASVVNTKFSQDCLPFRPFITPAFWYSPTRRSKKFVLPCRRNRSAAAEQES